jgi:hypothetical protein
MQHLEAQKSDTVNRVLIGAAVLIIGFYLLTEHRAHLFGALPYLLILACPLMHIFMHRSHGDHAASRDSEVKGVDKEKIKQGESSKACH